MPIYEYKCDNGHVFDVLQKMSDEPLTECRECGAPARRVLSPVAIHFKGSGFHNTDYRKSRGGDGASDSGADSGDSSSGSGSSDSSSSDSSSGGGSKSDSGKSDKPKAAAAD